MAIGKGTPYTPEELEEDEAYRARPQWFKFFYAAWLVSTQTMDDDQKGWYMTLLTWAASEGEPPGYLPEDEDELKAIAGFKILNPGIAHVLKCGVQIPGEVMEGLDNIREQKWQKVRRKFISTQRYPGLVYNKRLLDALKEAYRRTELQREHGRKGGLVTQGKYENERNEAAGSLAPSKQSQSRGEGGAEKHESRKLQEQRELKAGSLAAAKAGPQAGGKEPAKAILSLSLPLSEDIQDSQETTQDEIRGLSLDSPDEEREEPLSGNVGSDDYVLDTQEISQKVKKGEGGASKSKKAVESLFEEDKFRMTVKMKAFLQTKYPELTDGDLDWLKEKFCLRFYGKRYVSWSRTFYNFVSNQLVKYGYEPGSYDWRSNRARPNQQTERPDEAKGPDRQERQRPWESAADRNARLEREGAELSRQLRSGGQRHHTEDAPALSLATDDN